MLFRVESRFVTKTKSSNSSEFKYAWKEALRFSDVLKQFLELYGKIDLIFYFIFNLLYVFNWACYWAGSSPPPQGFHAHS